MLGSCSHLVRRTTAPAQSVALIAGSNLSTHERAEAFASRSLASNVRFTASLTLSKTARLLHTDADPKRNLHELIKSG